MAAMPWLVTTGASILPAALFVSFLIALSLAAGRRLMHWLGARGGGDVWERGVVAFVLGAGLLQFIPFVLGAGRLLSVVSLRVTLALLALLLIPDGWAVARRVRRELADVKSRNKLGMGWFLALSPAVLAAALIAVTPAIDNDGIGYHLTVPKRWLAAGSVEFLPTYPYSNAPMGVEMLFMVGLALAGDVGAKLTHYALGVLGALGVYLAGKRLKGAEVGAVASALYLVGPVGVVRVLGWAYLEGAIACATIAASLSWLVWFRTHEKGWLRCAALLAGIGVSFKLTAALLPLALAALTAVVVWDTAAREGRPRARSLLVLVSLVPFVLGPVLPWFVRSALYTGNPFFPLLAGLFPTRDYAAEIGAMLQHSNRYLFWAADIGQNWSLGVRKLILLGVAAMMVGGASFAWLRSRSAVSRGAVLVVLGISLVQLSAVGLYARYWLPILAVLQLPVLAILYPLLSVKRWAVFGIGLVALASLYQATWVLKSVGSPSEAAKVALGLEEQQAFLRKRLPLFPIAEYANHELPAGSKLMLSPYFCPGFHFDQTTYCPDPMQGSLRFRDVDVLTQDVRRLGVTHVMAPKTLMTEPPSAAENWRMPEYLIARLVRERGRLLFGAADQELYALEPEAASSRQ